MTAIVAIGLPASGSADFTDPDLDCLNDWQEWLAGTIPTNSTSVLRLLDPERSASGLVVTWQSVTNRTYFIERSSSLVSPAPFVPQATNIAGLPGTTSYTDTNAGGAGPFFYRVGVQ